MMRTELPKHWSLGALMEQAHQSLLHQFPEFHELQSASLARFAGIGLPHRKMEHWKYTNLMPLVERVYQVKPTMTHSLKPSSTISEAIVVHCVNGCLSLSAPLPEGVRISDTQSALLEKKLSLTALLSANQTDSMFDALNQGLMTNGWVIQVAPGVVVKRPIHLIYETQGDAVMQHPRHWIDLGERSQATIVESYQGLGDYFNNVVSKIHLGPSAHLTYYQLQDEGKSAIHIASTEVTCDANAQFRAFHLGLGARISRDDLTLQLQSEGALSDLHAFYFPRSGQLIDYHTRINHMAANTQSHQYYKTLVRDKSRGVFNGKVFVAQDSQKITAHQKHECLLLSDHAEMDTKPELEIYADDVICTHGATVGQLDDAQLFYLQTRGFSEQEAKAVLTRAFAESTLEAMPNSAVLEFIAASAKEVFDEVA